MNKLKVDNYLYQFRDVRNVIDFINSKMITEYEILENSYKIDCITYVDLKLLFTTFHLEDGEKHYTFTIVSLFPSHVYELKRDIKNFLK